MNHISTCNESYFSTIKRPQGTRAKTLWRLLAVQPQLSIRRVNVNTFIRTSLAGHKKEAACTPHSFLFLWKTCAANYTEITLLTHISERKKAKVFTASTVRSIKRERWRMVATASEKKVYGFAKTFKCSKILKIAVGPKEYNQTIDDIFLSMCQRKP